MKRIKGPEWYRRPDYLLTLLVGAGLSAPVWIAQTLLVVWMTR